MGLHAFSNLCVELLICTELAGGEKATENQFYEAEVLNSNSKYWMPAEPSGFHSNWDQK